MDSYTPNQQPNTSSNMFEGRVPERKPVGPWAGIVIVVLLLAAGGFYFWGAQLNNRGPETPQPFILGDDAEQGDAAAGIPAEGTSDETAALEAELDSFNLDQFDTQMQSDVNAF